MNTRYPTLQDIEYQETVAENHKRHMMEHPSVGTHHPITHLWWNGEKWLTFDEYLAWMERQ